jgi:tetratricopeptide (TPR) repeat protein
MMQAETLYWRGDFTQARRHSECGIDLYDPEEHTYHIHLYGNDTGIGNRILQALSLWHLGLPEQASVRMDELLMLARGLSHPFTLVFSLHFAAIVHQLLRMPKSALELVDAQLQIATDRGFALYVPYGTVLRGGILAELGQEREGIAEMREGMAMVKATFMLVHTLALLGKACGRVGEVEEGLRVLRRGLRLAEKTGGRCWEAELYRLQGELLLDNGEEAEAGSCFQRAIEVAQRQEAKSWELRAATSLAHLWQRQGKREQACEQLQSVYKWFTEGFDTADLREAKALLAALA